MEYPTHIWEIWGEVLKKKCKTWVIDLTPKRGGCPQDFPYGIYTNRISSCYTGHSSHSSIGPFGHSCGPPAQPYWPPAPQSYWPPAQSPMGNIIFITHWLTHIHTASSSYVIYNINLICVCLGVCLHVCYVFVTKVTYLNIYVPFIPAPEGLKWRACSTLTFYLPKCPGISGSGWFTGA